MHIGSCRDYVSVNEALIWHLLGDEFILEVCLQCLTIHIAPTVQRYDGTISFALGSEP